MRRWTATTAALATAATLALASPAAAEGVVSTVKRHVLTVTGGDGADAVRVGCSDGDVKINGANPRTGKVGCVTIVRIRVRLGAGNDALDLHRVDAQTWPSLVRVVALGGDGDDRLVGSQGNDRLSGQGGDDVLDGLRGADRLAPGGDGGDVDGGPGTDRMIVAGGGTWTVTDERATRTGTVDAAIPLRSIEKIDITGGSTGDRISADTFSGDAILDGGKGADRLSSGLGFDLLVGGSGDDHLSAGRGRDVLMGGDDDDVLLGGFGRDQLIGGAGDDRCIGGGGADSYRGC